MQPLVETPEHDAEPAAADDFENLVMAEPAQAVGLGWRTEENDVVIGGNAAGGVCLRGLLHDLLHDFLKSRIGRCLVWTERAGFLLPGSGRQLLQGLLAGLAFLDVSAQLLLLAVGKPTPEEFLQMLRVGTGHDIPLARSPRASGYTVPDCWA